MQLDFNDEKFYKPECKICGPIFINCFVCIIKTIARCLSCCKYNNNDPEIEIV